MVRTGRAWLQARDEVQSLTLLLVPPLGNLGAAWPATAGEGQGHSLPRLIPGLRDSFLCTRAELRGPGGRGRACSLGLSPPIGARPLQDGATGALCLVPSPPPSPSPNESPLREPSFLGSLSKTPRPWGSRSSRVQGAGRGEKRNQTTPWGGFRAASLLGTGQTEKPRPRRGWLARGLGTGQGGRLRIWPVKCPRVFLE